MTERDRLLADLVAELEATAELPVERSAARWIGEAEAVAADIARGDPDTETVERRVGHVRELLGHVETSGHPEADEHVETADAIAGELLDGLN